MVISSNTFRVSFPSCHVLIRTPFIASEKCALYIVMFETRTSELWSPKLPTHIPWPDPQLILEVYKIFGTCLDRYAIISGFNIPIHQLNILGMNNVNSVIHWAIARRTYRDVIQNYVCAILYWDVDLLPVRELNIFHLQLIALAKQHCTC